jgi:hypothetical protein
MDEPWRELRVGDQVRIVRRPQQGMPWSRLDNDARRLYDRLIAEGVVLAVSEIDEWGCPWIEYHWRHEDGSLEYHQLAIDDDSWELVARTPLRGGETA